MMNLVSKEAETKVELVRTRQIRKTLTQVLMVNFCDTTNFNKQINIKYNKPLI